MTGVPPARAPPEAPTPGPGDPRHGTPEVDVLVATYNSAATLRGTLASARRHLPVRQIIVVDRESTDGSDEIARSFGARVLSERVGLGRARNLALHEATTDPVLFLDSDVEIVRPDFYPAAVRAFRVPATAAVVGMSVGHLFRYGLPLGLTLIGRRWAIDAGIPDGVQGRETYYLQRAARREHRLVRYVPESMVHHGTYRRSPNWPEWQGAWVRRTSEGRARELLYAYLVVLLMHSNSRRPANVLYTPVFWLKLSRGFFAPARWDRMPR